MFSPRLFVAAADERVLRLLEHVVHGEEEQARAMLQENPTILHIKGRVTDYMGRTFFNASAYQCALWTLDTRYMAGMMLNCLPHDASGNAIREELLRQHDEVEAGLDYEVEGVPYKSSHYAFDSIELLQKCKSDYLRIIAPYCKRSGKTEGFSDEQWIEGAWWKGDWSELQVQTDDFQAHEDSIKEEMDQLYISTWKLIVEKQGGFPAHLVQHYCDLEHPFVHIYEDLTEEEQVCYGTPALSPNSFKAETFHRVTTARLQLRGGDRVIDLFPPKRLLTLGKDHGLILFFLGEKPEAIGSWPYNCFDRPGASAAPGGILPAIYAKELSALQRLREVRLEDRAALKTALQTQLGLNTGASMGAH